MTYSYLRNLEDAILEKKTRDADLNKHHPVCYFDTVILIFCYFLPYLLYYFTSLVIIGNSYISFFLSNFDKPIKKKLQNYAKKNDLKENFALI